MIPAPVDYQRLLTQVLSDIEPEIGRGRVADHIPALGTVDPHQFGMAVADVDGSVTGVGACEEPFSIQSVSKVFALALVVASDGATIWSRVGREPSGNPYNSLVQLEHEKGIPRNPFINSGAIVTTDRLLSLTEDARGAVLGFLQRESGNAEVDFDPVVAGSEVDHGARNAALGYFMASHGNMENPVAQVLEHYFWQCSIRASCRDLALTGLTLARHGVRGDGSRLLNGNDAKRINAIMLTCGTYDAAGEFAYRVGLPGKSGVGGGILAIVPGRCAVCVWSPGLDTRGNSVAGVAALDRFTTLTGWSVFWSSEVSGSARAPSSPRPPARARPHREGVEPTAAGTGRRRASRRGGCSTLPRNPLVTCGRWRDHGEVTSSEHVSRWTRATVYPDMWVDPTDDPREAGEPLTDERSTLVEYLRRYRVTLEMKCDGLDADQLARRSVPPSSMSLLGLVRHLADVERSWFRRVMSGQDAPPLFYSEEDHEGDWNGAVADPAVVDEAWAAWREEVAFAEHYVAHTDLTTPGKDGVQLREVLVHMIEEYARHCGHADLLRERIDGRVGQ